MGIIAVFYGADHKCGTSMLAQSAAEYAAEKNKDMNVLLIHTESGCGELYCPSVSESLESIRPYLAEKLIDSRALIEKSRYKDNLFIIGGPVKPGSSALYQPDMAQYLLDSLSASFDIVICDAGAEFEHAMSLGALFSADKIFVVTTQHEHAVRRYEWTKALFKKLGINPSAVIVNCYSSFGINTPEMISERAEISEDRLLFVRKSENGQRAEEDNRTILSLRDVRFTKDIAKICERILTADSGSDAKLRGTEEE